MQLPLQRRAAERPRRDYAEHRGRGVCRGDRGLRRRQIHPHLRGQRAHTPPLHRRLLRVGDGERAGHRRGQTGGNRPVCRGRSSRTSTARWSPRSSRTKSSSGWKTSASPTTRSGGGWRIPSPSWGLRTSAAGRSAPSRAARSRRWRLPRSWCSSRTSSCWMSRPASWTPRAV